ncbi:MAG: single-stranded-DNA-specific exonuclease RecJ [bacterium]
MYTRWLETECDEETARTLARELLLPPPIARLLVSRGYVSAERAHHFLNPDLANGLGKPFDFPCIREAVDRIWAAIHAKTRIIVYGDFDVDGVVATATLVKALQRLGADVSPFLPLRDPEGYGLTLKALERCLSERLDSAGGTPPLFITVDCGITSVAEVTWLMQRGMEVIITDHHEPGATLPPAAVIVNPRVAHSPGAEALCGAGIAFKLVHALVDKGRAEGWYTGVPMGGDLLPAVGLATVADVVSLTGENRTLVSSAIRNWKRAGVGLTALFSRAAQHGREDVSAFTFSFLLGPRINAAGRMGTAMAAYELLTTSDKDRAAQLAAELNALNAERMSVEKRMMTAARIQCGLEGTLETISGAVVAAGAVADGWHPGVIGIVAARLSEMTGLPAAVIAVEKDGSGRGSIRAGEGYHATGALKHVKDLLEGFGGHARAAGLTLKKGCLEAFRERFKAVCDEQHQGMSATHCALTCDGWLTPEELSLTFYAFQQQLAPFGEGNPTPRWGLKGILFKTISAMGQEKEHLQAILQLPDGKSVRGVWFRRGNLAEKLKENPGPCNLLFELQRNDFGGQSTVELRMIALASASEFVVK